MALRGPGGRSRPSGLDQRDRLADEACLVDRPREADRILDSLDVQAECRDAIVVAHQLDKVLKRHPLLVADREEIADRQRALAEHQVQRNRAALADQRDAALGGLADDLVRPERHAVEEIDKTIAVRSEKRQVACGFVEFTGEAQAVRRGRFGKAGREADEPAGAAPVQSCRDVWNVTIGGRKKRRVRRLRQLVDGPEIMRSGR